MPTENPKISAYVPQVVYDRFKQFQEERGLSMSQATIELLVEYFGVDLVNNSTKEFTGGLPDRVGKLEQELVNLKQSYVRLFEEVVQIKSTSKLLNIESDIADIRDDASISEGGSDSELPQDIIADLSSESESSSKDELLVDTLQEAVVSELSSSSDSKPHKQLDLIEPENDSNNELLDELKSNPLQGKLLVLRLNVNTSTLSSKKAKLSQDNFYGWLQSQDIDGIRWLNLSQGRSKGYVPADDTPVEKLQSLKDWIQENA
ncbi:hypothetical protein H6G36_30540 [Anabaena minutissima FACHB-250]|nr:hypothetical protein [Anabaena minutissima FACHB-250]